jgi:glycosyltransferase involved in cell wall biosynthesis
VKVLVVNSMAPFVWGGAEELAVHLKSNIETAGHRCEILRIPFQWEPATRIPSQMLLVRALELANVDRVIGLKFPAYLIRHPHKTLWLLHQYRQAYDLYDAHQTNLPDDATGTAVRRLIGEADRSCFEECRTIFTNSHITRDRLMKYSGFNAKVLLPPVNDPQLFPGAAPGGYIFAGGRVNDMKRQHLLLRALARAPRSVHLVIAGPPDTDADGRKLRELAEQLGVADRVSLDLRFLPRSVYAGYVNAASAVAYIPFDEDSLGYVAMEAATAGKALITTGDSGGILGLAKQGLTGWVCEPAPESLAQAMVAACSDEAKTRALGQAAREHWLQMGVSWELTVERLLS